jgi:hypothetical protein
VKKLTISTLSLLILLLLSHGALPAEKPNAFETKSKAIIALDSLHEEIPGPEKEDKKAAFIQHASEQLALTSLSVTTLYGLTGISSLSAFLTAVFFQSNYVIKPL